MRFDMRAPSGGPTPADLYAAAIDMAVWAEPHRCLSVVVSEHHAAEDGYLPAPLLLATAVAARTTTLPITVAVVLLPLHDPVRLAEEMVVLDIISRGRTMFVAGLGYRRREYEMFGVDYSRRGRIADESLAVLLRARTGEAFVHDGRPIHVTPAPFTPGGPMVAWGGGSVAAARRAGRHGIGLFAQSSEERLREEYEAAAIAAGHRPGMCFLPAPDEATTVFVAEDVDAAWDELGPYLLHDASAYAAWASEGTPEAASRSTATTVDQLRAERGAYRVLGIDEAIAAVRSGSPLALQPLVGGLPPEIAWRYLRVVGERVLPAVG